MHIYIYAANMEGVPHTMDKFDDITIQIRTAGEVTFTVTVDDQEQTFTADSTTTGNAAVAARKLLSAVKSDSVNWIYNLNVDADEPDSYRRRRAQIVAVARVGAYTQTVEMDTTTNGSVREAAAALVNAAWEDLWDWTQKARLTA